MAKQRRFVLKFANNCKCKGCAGTLMKVQEIKGVDSTSKVTKTGELTIWGCVDPQEVIGFLDKKGKKAELVMGEILPKKSNRNDVLIKLSVSKAPQQVVDHDSNDQNLVEQVQKLMQNVNGFKELEVTHLKTVKKKKDEVITKNKTRIKVVMDDDHYHGPGLSGNYFPPAAGYKPSAPPYYEKVGDPA